MAGVAEQSTFGSKASAEAWAEAIERPPSVDCEQLARLVLKRKPAVVQRAIRTALNSQYSDARSLALVLLTLTAIAGTAVGGREALQRLTDDQPRRVTALAWLDPGVLFNRLVDEFSFEGDDDIEELVDDIARLMKDPTSIVRQRAALAFGLLGDFRVRGLTPLLRLAEEDPDGDAVVGSILGLWATGQDAGIFTVRDAAFRDPDWRVRSAAGALLASIGELETLRDVDSRVVSAVTSALVNPLEAAASSQLLRLLRVTGADMVSRRLAALRLAHSDDPDLVAAANEFATRNASSPELEGFLDELVAAGLREESPTTDEPAL